MAETITRQVKTDTSMNLVFPPGAPVRLGDVMERDDSGVWVPIGNLYDWVPGFPLETVNDPTPGDFSASSERGYDFDVKVSGKTSDLFKSVALAKAGVRVRLNGDSSFVLSLAGATFTRIKDTGALWAAYRKDHSMWTWDLGRRIVTTVVKADQATFLASAKGGATYELEAKGDVDAANIQVADLATKFKLVSTMSGATTFVGKEATPLYRSHKMHLTGGIGAAAAGGTNTVDEFDLDDEPTDED
jgi:hypothetical protein